VHDCQKKDCGDAGSRARDAAQSTNQLHGNPRFSPWECPTSLELRPLSRSTPSGLLRITGSEILHH
jgi:hypothetical protein